MAKYRVPREALPVAKILRRDVRRPKKLPKLEGSPESFYGSSLRWSNGYEKCPMGLHPRATDELPTNCEDFPACDREEAIKAFYEWWDGLEDPLAAVDALWPVKKTATKKRKKK